MRWSRPPTRRFLRWFSTGWLVLGSAMLALYGWFISNQAANGVVVERIEDGSRSPIVYVRYPAGAVLLPRLLPAVRGRDGRLRVVAGSQSRSSWRMRRRPASTIEPDSDG